MVVKLSLQSLFIQLKSHRELTATKYAQYKEKIHRLQKQLQVCRGVPSCLWDRQNIETQQAISGLLLL